MTTFVFVIVVFYICSILFYYGCIKKGLIISPDFVPEQLKNDNQLLNNMNMRRVYSTKILVKDEIKDLLHMS